MRTVLSVSLPGNMADELDTYARETGRNKSDIVKESLGIFLWEARFRTIRKKLAKKGKVSKIITDEDVFKVVS